VKKKPKKAKHSGRKAITVLIDPALLKEFDAINRRNDKGVGGQRIRVIAGLIEKFVAEQRLVSNDA